MKPGSPIYSVPCLATNIFLGIIRLLGAHKLPKKFDLGKSPKIGKMRVIPNSKNKYLKKKLGPLSTGKLQIVKTIASGKPITTTHCLDFPSLYFLGVDY